MRLSRKRDELDYIREAVEAVIRGYSITRATMYMNTNYVSMKKVMNKLIDKGIVEPSEHVSAKRQGLRLTEKGIHLRELLINLQYELYTNGGTSLGEELIRPEELEERARQALAIINSKKRRSRVDIFFTILYHCSNAPKTLWTIANSCFLNIEKAREYVEELLEVNMLSVVNESDQQVKYKTTEKGLRFMTIYLKIFELIYI